MSLPVVITRQVAPPQSRNTLRPLMAKAAEIPSTRKPFRYGSSVYFDQLIQETFGPYGSSYGLSSRYETKIPVDLSVLQELCDLRSTVDRASDIACINRWIRLLAESINLPASKFGIRSFFDDEEEKEQSASSSAPQRSVVKDSYEEERTYIDSSSLFICAEDDKDEDINVYHDDLPADFGPMVEEE
jgi:hypothetical protein